MKHLTASKLNILLIGGAFIFSVADCAMAQSIGGGNPVGSFRKGLGIIKIIAMMIGGVLAVTWIISGASKFNHGDSEGGWRALIAAMIVAGADALVYWIFGAFGQSPDGSGASPF